jgi:hypothetical protein
LSKSWVNHSTSDNNDLINSMDIFIPWNLKKVE